MSTYTAEQAHADGRHGEHWSWWFLKVCPVCQQLEAKGRTVA